MVETEIYTTKFTKDEGLEKFRTSCLRILRGESNLIVHEDERREHR